MAKKTADPVEDFLFAKGAPTISWKNVKKGTVQGGVVTDKDVSQQTDYRSGELLWWDDQETRPRNQLVLTLATDYFDDEIEDDDGERRLFVKGKMQQALAKAVKDAGHKTVEIGSEVWVTFTGTEPSEDRKLDDTKLYGVEYIPADESTLNTDDTDDEDDDDEEETETEADEGGDDEEEEPKIPKPRKPSPGSKAKGATATKTAAKPSSKSKKKASSNGEPDADKIQAAIAAMSPEDRKKFGL